MDDIEYIRYIIENLILIVSDYITEEEYLAYKEDENNKEFDVSALIKYIFEYVELYTEKLGIKATTEFFKDSYLIKYNGNGYEIEVINDLNKTYYFRMISLDDKKDFIDLNNPNYDNIIKPNKKTLSLN